MRSGREAERLLEATEGRDEKGRWLFAVTGCIRTPVSLGDISSRLIPAGKPGFLTPLSAWVGFKKIKLCTCSFVLSSASAA